MQFQLTFVWSQFVISFFNFCRLSCYVAITSHAMYFYWFTVYKESRMTICKAETSIISECCFKPVIETSQYPMLTLKTAKYSYHKLIYSCAFLLITSLILLIANLWCISVLSEWSQRFLSANHYRNQRQANAPLATWLLLANS